MKIDFIEIFNDLRSRGEKSIKMHANGTITSWHGQHTLNTWVIDENGLKCIDCNTIY